MTANALSPAVTANAALAAPDPALAGALVPLTPTPISELRAWLDASRELLQRLHPSDPKYKAGLVIWEQRNEAYMARALAEGEPE